MKKVKRKNNVNKADKKQIKNNWFLYLVIFIIFIVVGIIVLLITTDNDTDYDLFTHLLIKEEKMDLENNIITTYEKYQKLFDNNKLTRSDFINNNYVVIELIIDECSESNFTLESYSYENGIITVNGHYDASCGVCAPYYDYYLLKVDKSITNATVEQNFVRRNEPNCEPDVCYKPMIYLYPTKTTNVLVKLGFPNNLTVTYPKYNNGWEVTAYKDGTLVDKNNKSYYGLYWEGLNYNNINFDTGFVVSKNDLIDFFEEKLSILGLNEKEMNEFIIYWLPILSNNEYNLIKFIDIETINSIMPLEITPSADTIIRILMAYKPLNEKIGVKEQKLEKVSRKGFTVVEWGGTLVKYP